MNPETEIASPAEVRNGWDRSDATITHDSDTMSESSESNGGKGIVRGSHANRGGHQGRGGRGG